MHLAGVEKVNKQSRTKHEGTLNCSGFILKDNKFLDIKYVVFILSGCMFDYFQSEWIYFSIYWLITFLDDLFKKLVPRHIQI